jgi:hypothetical protein
LFCFVLFCFVLFCFVLFCFVLFCFVLFCFVLFYFILFCFVLFCFVLFCFILFYFILFYFILFYFILFCCLCCVVLCCIMNDSTRHAHYYRCCCSNNSWGSLYCAFLVLFDHCTSKTDTCLALFCCLLTTRHTLYPSGSLCYMHVVVLSCGEVSVLKTIHHVWGNHVHT